MRNHARRTAAAVAVLAAVALQPSTTQAQDWQEMRSAHFKVMSSAGQSSTRTLVWQLEQIRNAIDVLFDWARVDLDRPIAVIAVKDERSMRALTPEYWEQKGGIRPVSVMVTGPDQHYLAIRADVQAEDRHDINPHINAYYSYASLILRHSFDQDLPLWVSSGFAAVLSNTIVRDSHVLFGVPIPWHLGELQAGGRMPLATLMKVTRNSPEYTRESGRERFDAQSWALVHFLMFGEGGARRSQLDRYLKMTASGAQVDVAMREAFGPTNELEADWVTYISRSLFTFLRADVDASVKREAFATRQMSPSESAAGLALFHVAMNRPIEARTHLDKARQSAPVAPDSFLAEALLMDREGKRDEARAAYERAVEGRSESGYAHFRLAALRWHPKADRDTLAGIEKLLLRAVALNSRHAPSNAFLADVRSLLGSGEALVYARRAIALAPSQPGHRLTAARILMRQKKYDEALTEAQAALTRASAGDAENARALIASIERAKAAAAGADIPPAAAPTPPGSSTAGAAAVRVGPGTVAPRLLEETKPLYTEDAMRMGLEGRIMLEVAVMPDGMPGEITVTRCDLKSRFQDSTRKEDAQVREALQRSQFRAGACTETFGLERQAVEAVRRWRFTPGTRNGAPLPVLVEVEMTFTLK